MLGIYIRKVVGRSMEPKLKEGDFVVVCAWLKYFMIKGFIYEIHHSSYGKIIKAYESFNEGLFWFYGFSKHGVSQSEIGGLSKHKIKGMVVFVIKNKK